MRRRVVIPAILLLAFWQAAFAQTQLIQNGSFAATTIAPWVATGSGISFGNGYLSMGNYPGAVQSVYQTVTFPTNLIGATLSLYYETVTTNPLSDDTLTTYLVSTNNQTILATLGTITGLNPTSGYVYAAGNLATYPGSNTLSSYAGQTVELYFYAQTDPSSYTSFNITDVSLLIGTTANIPANDNFANATPIPPAGITNDVNTTYSSKEPGEPNHAGNTGGRSVWWTWTAPAIGTVNINTYGSSFGTLLAVYTGSPVSGLTPVVSNNGVARGTGWSLVKFNVGAGMTYQIAVDGYNDEGGSAVLNFSFSQDKTAPTAAFSSPAAGAAVSNSLVLVKGTANDNVGVAGVQYLLKNASGATAWQPVTTTNQWTNWFATVTNLIPGTNLVEVQAFDTSSNLSTLVSRVFDYDVPTPLALSTNGRGTIYATNELLTNGQLFNLAFPYKITARAAPGFAFAGWTGSLVTNSTNLSFIMAANLAFTANFADVRKPTNSLTAPTPNQRWSNSVFLITGKAVDNVGVASVYYQLNGGTWNAAVSTNFWTNWTASVTLTPGTNTVRAYAEDASGNLSSTNSATFLYALTTPLMVEMTGKGILTPNDNGQFLQIGENYSITASAVAGFKFTNWTGSFPTNKAKLTFRMASNLTLIANFADVQPPVITITSPAANQRWSNSTFTVMGTAKDNVAVASVFCQLNGSSWNAATSANFWTNWTINLAPLQRTNVVLAYSQDTSGNNSPTNKVTFLYIPSATLTVGTNGLGSITPVDNGKLLAVGTNYTLTAVASNHWLFSNWVAGGSGNFVSNNPALKFTMQSNLVLTANFVTNPFLAVAGVYNGLFYPTNGVTEASSGFINVTISSNSTGAYSAKLLLDDGSNSFSGSFDLTGNAQTNLARAGKTPVSVTLALDFNAADALMGGSVSNATAGWNSVIQADRAVFSTTANPATNYAGQFTLLLPPGAGAPLTSPDGYGYAAITNTLGGNSTLAGALADGAPFMESVPISQNGGIPLYQSLYAGKGSLLGWIYFTNEPPRNISTNSSVSWIKPSLSNALYPSGFTNITGVLGSPYTNTAKAGVPVLNLTSASLILTNGNLTNGFLIYTNIGTNLSSHNTLTNLDAGNTNLSPTNHLVIAINTNNGLVTVTFQATGLRTNTIAHGAVLQNQTNAQGYFLGTNQSGALIISPQ